MATIFSRRSRQARAYRQLPICGGLRMTFISLEGEPLDVAPQRIAEFARRRWVLSLKRVAGHFQERAQ